MRRFQPSFADRSAAGRELAPYLAHLASRQPIVLGIAMGGVEVAAEVADHLQAEFDMMVAHRLGAPVIPELTVGAVVSDGVVYLHPGWTDKLSQDYLDESIGLLVSQTSASERAIRGSHPPRQLLHRVVILVDDGIATGATMLACIGSILRRKPRRVVVAVPVGAQETCRYILHSPIEDLVCPYRTADFLSVASYYRDFPERTEGQLKSLVESHGLIS